MSIVVVTGSDGFVGRSLTAMLSTAGHRVIPVAREHAVLGDRHLISSSLESAMRDSHAVIHLAGRAHVIDELHNDPLGEFRKVNLDGTLSIAEMAASVGVARFVFVSSIGVLGNTSGGRMFNEDDAPSPKGPYAVSKWQAEQGLHSVAKNSRLQIVVVRPPLVYGPHVKGNFLRLLRLVASGIPLPFSAIQNCRSYVGVHNLCDFLISCTFHPSANGRTFNVADGEDVSTPELLQIIATAMGKRARIFRCPLSILRATAVVLGKKAELERLTTNLRVDSSFARATLGWQPTQALRVGIAEMVHWFMREPRS
jgi:UDP-N-acetyl-alpha-D-quinovosamine dehydrogenase